MEKYSPPEEHLLVLHGNSGFCYKCDREVKVTDDGECKEYASRVHAWRRGKAFAERR